MGRVRAVLGVLGCVLAVNFAAASPAAAHDVSGVQPTNYRTSITSETSPSPGVTVRAVDLGDRLQLTNESGRHVVVLGYDGEPYLRVDEAGVQVNRRSPAFYLNRSRDGSAPVPRRADPDAAPEWRHVSGGATVRWHDHRAHWMGANDPPSVQASPGTDHVVRRFALPLEVDGQRVVVRGEVRWIPGPSPWPWLGFAVLLATVIVAACFTRRWAWVVAAGTIVLMVAEAVHLGGLFGATTASALSTLWASIFSIGGLVLGALALVWLARSGPHAATPLFVVAALVLLIAGGLSDIQVLWKSQLPTTFTADFARGIVASILGLGTAIVIGAGLHLRTGHRAGAGQPHARSSGLSRVEAAARTREPRCPSDDYHLRHDVADWGDTP